MWKPSIVWTNWSALTTIRLRSEPPHWAWEHWPTTNGDNGTNGPEIQKKNNLPWSSTLSMAYFTHKYWMISLTQKCTEQDYSRQLGCIEQRLNHTPTKHGSINKNIRKAWQELRTIQQRAAAAREEFLDSLLTTAKQMKDKSRQWAIFQLRQAELNRRCFAAVKSILKPRSPGRLTHLLIPNENDSNTWKTIDDPKDIEQNLLSFCQSHFATAHGSPFTIPPYPISYSLIALLRLPKTSSTALQK